MRQPPWSLVQYTLDGGMEARAGVEVALTVDRLDDVVHLQAG